MQEAYVGYIAHTMWMHYTLSTKQGGQRQIECQRVPEQKYRQNINKVKMGIEVPRNTREALLFDKQNKNTLWVDAIYKEMSGLRRLNVFKFHAPNVDALYRVYKTRRAKTNRMSKNTRTEIQTKHKNKVKMGIEVPRNTREAFLFDKQNKNTLWVDAIYKEMSGLRRLNVFKFHAPNVDALYRVYKTRRAKTN
jgi:hypothetical protein